ncbi:hypothetical protein GGI21_000049 [Coemansia aciculifera]|nr:hypothetical protein GGI21_000049 [Coemansia aciculifera]
MDNSNNTQKDNADEGIARLLQTVIDARALIGTKEDVKLGTPVAGTTADVKLGSPIAENEPGTLGDDDSSSSSSSDLDSDSSMDEDSEDDEDEEDGDNDTTHMAVSDDDDEGGGAAAAIPTTRNEILDAQIQQPTLSALPATAPLTSLGTIHSIVDNAVVIIQAHISGERHVLDTESILAFDDRQVLGLVHDVFGPVTRPMYTVRFGAGAPVHPNAAVGRSVFFSPQWTTMLATEKLRVRGTDASNEYDEEVGDDAMEFSDDEEEREHRKNVKKNRQLAAQHRMQAARPPPPPTAAAAPAAAVAAATSTAEPPLAPQNTRKLQSYQDLYDADLGF